MLRTTYSFSLPVELLDRLRQASQQTGLSLSKIICQGLELRLREIERQQKQEDAAK